MPILNYTTGIDANKTIIEIQQKLAKASVRRSMIEYDESGNPIAVTFAIDWKGQLVGFRLPCNFEGVLNAMKKSKKVAKRLCTREQALRVGWRIVKDWVEAQLAIVEAEVAAIHEVFLPYAIAKDGKSVYTWIEESRDQNLLTYN